MSSEEDTIVPIKLAQRFIHIIDFHADPVTCVSASSGTVSYDSIQSPRHGRSDLILAQDAIHCVSQPPRPHDVSKLKRVFNKELLEILIPLDLDTFRAMKKETFVRRLGMRTVSKPVNDFIAASKEFDLALKECLVNFKKSENDETKKGVFNINIEFPSKIPVPVNQPAEKFSISQTTLTPKLSSRILDLHGSKLDGQEQVDVALIMCPDKFYS
ncbi:Protein CBG18290 [Caenorhabditis briggsae]|uniref:Protein CBG18290 n=1 Tax=Caenorhabditis briggsae TaxID=6238 RepID=A8XSC5_CAEBR|nr:Protein CBG18290 [Caenorhabditis briggsae]CAP35767.1 Protein CBG18290 [Caenorhabditis briggsae]